MSIARYRSTRCISVQLVLLLVLSGMQPSLSLAYNWSGHYEPAASSLMSGVSVFRNALNNDFLIFSADFHLMKSF